MSGKNGASSVCTACSPIKHDPVGWQCALLRFTSYLYMEKNPAVSEVGEGEAVLFNRVKLPAPSRGVFW